MSGRTKKRSEKVGLPPGTLVHIGREKKGTTRIDLIEYDAERLEKRRVGKAECLIPKPSPTVSWLNVDGISQVEVLQQLGGCYKIHPLVLEDILATDQRPKAEDFGEYLYVVLKMTALGEQGEIRSEQVSIVMGRRYLISFQEGLEGDAFEQVRGRLDNEQCKLRQSGPDMLLHALLDVIVDHYFLVLEKLAERIEEVEDEVVENPTSSTVQSIYRLKRDLLFLHKSVWPLREVVGGLQRRDSSLIEDSTVIYLKDLYDHTVQVLETLETLRDMVTSMLDIYLSSVSNRLNEVMKVLTVIATIFMPLSFIVGWYGMNFKNMPEYDWRYGYPGILFLMACIAGGMLIFFRRKRWL